MNLTVRTKREKEKKSKVNNALLQRDYCSAYKDLTKIPTRQQTGHDVKCYSKTRKSNLRTVSSKNHFVILIDSYAFYVLFTIKKE